MALGCRSSGTAFSKPSALYCLDDELTEGRICLQLIGSLSDSDLELVLGAPELTGALAEFLGPLVEGHNRWKLFPRIERREQLLYRHVAQLALDFVDEVLHQRNGFVCYFVTGLRLATTG